MMEKHLIDDQPFFLHRSAAWSTAMLAVQISAKLQTEQIEDTRPHTHIYIYIYIYKIKITQIQIQIHHME